MGDTSNSRDYRFLWSCIDNTTDAERLSAMSQGQRWPGFPRNPVQPNPIIVDVGRYTREVSPVPPLGGRKISRRNGGYVGLANYNTVP